ncbi:PepSY domain-containing protein [Actinocorallia longicatena]|uniref:PepSY domain-containing protein n=1 Tax=Actinocorallia longicatena TaxID=111803 RepID=A0ABP6QFH0_9ACTN
MGDGEHGRLVRDIDLLTTGNRWRDLRLDATTGRLLRDRADHGDSDDARILRSARPVAATAAARALKKVPGTVRSIELDDGAADRPVWKVVIRRASGAVRGVHIAARGARLVTGHDAGDDHGRD